MESSQTCENLDTVQLTEVPISPQGYNDILNFQNEILNMIASHEKSTKVLAQLCNLAEKLLPNSVASIMLHDKNTGLLSVLSAPSIPQTGHDALKNLKPGVDKGSCANSFFHNEPQFVSNTFEDSRWAELRKVAIDFNICSCWSMPVRNQDNRPIGTFALSSFEHRSPAPFHKKLLETAASIVNIVLKNQENDTKIENMRLHDKLTSLHNKTYLEELLQSNSKHTLILLNINNFSYINTAYGFEIGDKLLVQIANILKNNFATDATCRINSDEFALLFNKKIDIDLIVSKIKQYFYSQKIKIDNIELNISFSYGGVYGKYNILRNAALALKQAKENGKNNLSIFDYLQENINQAQREAFIEANNLLHNALSQDRLVPFFQGIRDNKTKKILKFESLVRIVNGEEIISPFIFLKAAKLSGLLPEITKVMIDKSFAIMEDNNYSFSINITEDDLSSNYLVAYLEKKSLQYHVGANRVTLEILEGISSNGKRNHISQLNQLKRKGYALAIDDFGSEYSNFERVLDLDIDFLKIDAKYIKDIDTNQKSYEITKAIAYFAHNANIPCIAEFVHNKNVQDIISTLGIEYSQGYYFSEPNLTPIGENASLIP